MMQVASTSMPSGTFTTNISSAMVWVAHVNTLMEVAVRPSPRSSRSGPPRRRAVAWSFGTHVTITVSPGARPVTSSPTASTSPVDSWPSTAGAARGL